MLTSLMWTLGHMHHEQDLHWTEYESNGKNDFHHIHPCVKLLDGKVGQTTDLDWLHVVGVFAVVFLPIITFIPTKYSLHSIKSKDTKMTNSKTLKNYQWKGFIGFETIPSMSKVIVYSQFFNIMLRGQILGDVPLGCNLHSFVHLAKT